MPSNLALFLPLVAGFLFFSRYKTTSLKSLTWDGPRLIFWAGVYGIILTIPARVISMVFYEKWRIDLANGNYDIMNAFLPLDGDYRWTLTIALVSGWLIPGILNRFVSDEWAVWLARRYANDFYRLLMDEIGTGRPIQVTLSNDQVYIGFVLEHPGIERRVIFRDEDDYFKLLPTLSGYREKDTHRLRLKVNYSRLLERFREAALRGEAVGVGYTLEDLQILLPVKQVASARRFDPSVYTEIFGEELPQTPSLNPEAPVVPPAG